MPCSEIAEYDFEIYQGDDKTVSFRYKANDVPVDITGYTIELECANPALSKTAVIVDALDGRYDFVYVPSDTISTESRRVKYEVVYWPEGLSGPKRTMHTGSILITEEVSP